MKNLRQISMPNMNPEDWDRITMQFRSDIINYPFITLTRKQFNELSPEERERLISEVVSIAYIKTPSFETIKELAKKVRFKNINLS